MVISPPVDANNHYRARSGGKSSGFINYGVHNNDNSKSYHSLNSENSNSGGGTRNSQGHKSSQGNNKSFRRNHELNPNHLISSSSPSMLN